MHASLLEYQLSHITNQHAMKALLFNHILRIVLYILNSAASASDYNIKKEVEVQTDLSKRSNDICLVFRYYVNNVMNSRKNIVFKNCFCVKTKSYYFVSRIETYSP